MLMKIKFSSEEKELGKLSDEEDGSEATGGPGNEDLPSEPATPNPVMPGEEGGQPTSDEDPTKPQWPSMQDLNSRLRRVITSYQRNFKKEEMKLAQKAKVFLLFILDKFRYVLVGLIEVLLYK